MLFGLLVHFSSGDSTARSIILTTDENGSQIDSCEVDGAVASVQETLPAADSLPLPLQQ